MNPAKSIHDEAAYWLIRREHARANAGILAGFETWLRSDARHRAAHLRLQTAWRRSAAFKRLRPLDRPVDPDLLTKELPKRNDGAALIEQLFREHNDALLRFLTTKLHSMQWAKEIAQEAYVRLLRLDRPEEVSFLRAFLFKTAANLAIDSMRSKLSETRRMELEFFQEPDLAPEPGRALAAEQELTLVARCINELAPKRRHAFMLRRVHGLPTEAIAKQMNLPERTVRQYVQEAMVYCRARLDELLGR